VEKGLTCTLGTTVDGDYAVQECDATMLNSITTVCYITIESLFIKKIGK